MISNSSIEQFCYSTFTEFSTVQLTLLEHNFLENCFILGRCTCTRIEFAKDIKLLTLQKDELYYCNKLGGVKDFALFCYWVKETFFHDVMESNSEKMNELWNSFRLHTYIVRTSVTSLWSKFKILMGTSALIGLLNYTCVCLKIHKNLLLLQMYSWFWLESRSMYKNLLMHSFNLVSDAMHQKIFKYSGVKNDIL